MQHFVGNLMHECGELLGWLHPGKKRDLPAMRKTLRGSDAFRKAKLEILRFDELEQAFAESTHIALHFAQCRQFLAFSLANVLSRDLRPSLCAPDGIRELMYFSMAVKRR